MKTRTINGIEARCYFKGNFWVTKDGKYAEWAFVDYKTGEVKNRIPYKIAINDDGEPYVRVKQKDGSYKSFSIARAVCTCWHGTPSIPSAKIVYKDEFVDNCDASNLKWDDYD